MTMPTARDPEAREDLLTAIALIRAAIAADFAGQAALMAGTNPTALLGSTAAVALVVGVEAHGSIEAFDAHLAATQARIVSG